MATFVILERDQTPYHPPGGRLRGHRGPSTFAVLRLVLQGYRDVEIARMLDLSRERVRQIRAREGLPRVPRPLPQPFPTRECSKCGRPFQPGTYRGHRCPDHQNVPGGHMETRICVECGRPFERRANQMSRPRSPGIYCDKRCMGRYLGRTYGAPALGQRAKPPAEAQALQEALAAAYGRLGSYAAVARELGLSRRKVYYWMVLRARKNKRDA